MPDIPVIDDAEREKRGIRIYSTLESMPQGIAFSLWDSDFSEEIPRYIMLVGWHIIHNLHDSTNPQEWLVPMMTVSDWKHWTEGGEAPPGIGEQA